MKKDVVLIGAAASYNDGMQAINPDYMNSILQTGAVPIMLAYTDDETQIEKYVELCDGIMFCGGDDIDPAYYNEERQPETENICSIRDSFECKLFKAAYEKDIPILGICRGLQGMNVFLGGSLHQDIGGHRQSYPRNEVSHEVNIVKGSFLHRIVGADSMQTNSFHHQAIKALGADLKVDAMSEDGIIEAVSVPDRRFCMGVQWHPESFWRTDSLNKKIFSAFVDACKN